MSSRSVFFALFSSRNWQNSKLDQKRDRSIRRPSKISQVRFDACKPDSCGSHSVQRVPTLNGERPTTRRRVCASAPARNDGPFHLLAWRKRIYSREGFKNLDDLVVPRQRRNEFLLLLPHQRRRIDSNDFFVLFVKLPIFESFANGLPEDLGEMIRCARRQILERSHAPKSPR